MAGLLVPWPSPECVNCRVLDLDLCQADRVGGTLQLLYRLGRDDPRCGTCVVGRFADGATRLLQRFRREQCRRKLNTDPSVATEI